MVSEPSVQETEPCVDDLSSDREKPSATEEFLRKYGAQSVPSLARNVVPLDIISNY
jgi:hypothetical protein